MAVPSRDAPAWCAAVWNWARPERRKPNVVVGLGNEIASDDGIGIRVAQELERRLDGNEAVDVVALPWAGFSLLDVLVHRERAAIIDCLCSGQQPPGTIVRVNESDLRGSVRLNSFHDIDYPNAIALARELDLPMPQEIAVWGVEGGNVSEFGDQLTPPVRVALGRVVRQVLRFFNVRDGEEARLVAEP